MKQYLHIIVSLLLLSCNNSTPEHSTYKDIIESIKNHTEVIELTSNNGQSRIVVSPQIQGKLITSSFDGLNGLSNGWINKAAFVDNKILFDNIGGEERLWLGPLGGQYSLYYQEIKPLNEDNWKVPTAIAKGAYQLIDSNSFSVTMKKEFNIKNYIGTSFKLEVLRKVSLFNSAQIESNLSINLKKEIHYVAYESKHSLINIGNGILKNETGLVSLWSAGMFEGTNKTTVIIPLKKSNSLDNIYKYMGVLNKTRLNAKSNILLYKADGKYRSKIGIPKSLAPSIYGCYSKEKQRLTIVQFIQTNDSLYANSNVTIQNNPYKGEVIPIYNNGTMDYSPTNEHSFYELESTSAMRELRPKSDTLKHWHRVYHFSGKETELNSISKQLLKIDLKDCKL